MPVRAFCANLLVHHVFRFLIHCSLMILSSMQKTPHVHVIAVTVCFVCEKREKSKCYNLTKFSINIVFLYNSLSNC